MYDHLYARDDANRSKRYAFCGYRCEEWRTREDHSSHTLRQLKSPLSNISSLGLAGLKSTGTFVIQGVTQVNDLRPP